MDNNFNFSMPCKELSYPIRTGTHAFTLPDTAEKGGKLTTVTGRVLPALQLHHCGNSQKYFLHKNTAPLSHSGHSEGDNFGAGQFLVPCASSQVESFNPSNPLVAGEFFGPCNSVILGRVLPAQRNCCGPIPLRPEQSWLHQHLPRRHHIIFEAAWFVYKLGGQGEPLHNNTCRRSEVAHVKDSLERHLNHSHTRLKGASTNTRHVQHGNVPSGTNVRPPAYTQHVFGSTNSTLEFQEMRQCVAVACKKGGKRQTVNHQAKNGQAKCVTCDLFNKSCKQLPHAHVQWHNISNDNTSQVGRPGAIRERTKHTKLQITHVLGTTCSS
jgi:hypothetical protein